MPKLRPNPRRGRAFRSAPHPSIRDERRSSWENLDACVWQGKPGEYSVEALHRRLADPAQRAGRRPRFRADRTKGTRDSRLVTIVPGVCTEWVIDPWPGRADVHLSSEASRPVRSRGRTIRDSKLAAPIRRRRPAGRRVAPSSLQRELRSPQERDRSTPIDSPTCSSSTAEDPPEERFSERRRNAAYLQTRSAASVSGSKPAPSAASRSRSRPRSRHEPFSLRARVPFARPRSLRTSTSRISASSARSRCRALRSPIVEIALAGGIRSRRTSRTRSGGRPESRPQLIVGGAED